MPESQHISHSIYCSPYISNQGCFLPLLMFYHPQLFASSGWCAVCPSQSTGCFCDVGGWCAAVSTGHHGHNLLSSTLLSSHTTDCPLSQVNQDQGLAQDITINEGFIAYKYSFCLSADYKTSFVSYDRVCSKICRVDIFYHGVLSSQICKMSLCNIQFKTSNDSFFFEHIFDRSLFHFHILGLFCGII